MRKQSGVVAKINLQNIRTPYFVTGLVFGITFVQFIIYAIIAAARGNAGVQLQPSSMNYLWLLVIMAAIFIPAKHYKLIANLGGKRSDFFWGGIITYAVLAAAVSLANTVYYCAFERFLTQTEYHAGLDAFLQDPSLLDNRYIIANVIELFGWSANNPIVIFIQQSAFLLLLAVVVHTLTAMQDRWYGWVTDVIIAAILGVLIPIAPLRSALLWFFNLILFHPSALMQVIACLGLATIIYAINKPILAGKTM